MATQNRPYFFIPTLNTERFLSGDEPTEQVMRDFLDSITFKLEVSDTATETQQGLVETATQAEFDNGTDSNANGFSLYVRPSMIKDYVDQQDANLQSQISINEQNIQQNANDITNIQNDITNIQNQFGEEMPLGSMIMYPVGGNAPNSKWMYCEGQTLDTTLYPDLFALIGYQFGGVGNNFSLPDLRKQFVAGYDDNGPTEYQTIGQGGGADSVTLTGAQSGTSSHSHTASTDGAGAHTHDFTINVRDGGTSGIAGLVERNSNEGAVTFPAHENNSISNPGDHTHNVTVDPSAGAPASEAHENRPAFVVFPFIIKVTN